MTVDVNKLKCHLSNRLSYYYKHKLYGIDCGDVDVDKLDKMSAILWALQTDCKIPDSIICMANKLLKGIKSTDYNCSTLIDPCDDGYIVDITDSFDTCSLGSEAIEIL